MTDWPVRLVFDTSAILEYCRESVHVGEILAEFSTDQRAVALPVACLAQAYPLVVDQERLDLLVKHDVTVVAGDEAEDWQTLGVLCALTGEFGPAAAARLALDLDCWVLTTRPDLYEQVAAGELAVTIGR